jgi:polysaccharide pyruvyl transferase WcaK-like protein
MIVEVLGIFPGNLGSLLMLKAIQRAVSERTGSRTTIRVPIRGLPEWLAQGSDIMVGTGGIGRMFDRVLSAVPSSMRRSARLAVTADVGLVLDASGFAYGDPWGERKIRVRLVSRLRSLAISRTPLVLLPQAFGPFNLPQLRSDMLAVIAAADRIYARDHASLAHLKALHVKKSNVFLAPDITVSLEGKLLPADQNLVGRACFVPNRKMLTMLDSKGASRYLQAVRSMVDQARRAGNDPFFLLHEGAEDKRLINELIESGCGRIQIVASPDPLRVKGILGMAGFVVSSRYHALVSALSQSVPVIALGWSHKYRELLQDYKVADFSLDVASDAFDATDACERIQHAAATGSLRPTLSAVANEQRAEVSRMWESVLAPVTRDAHAA